MNSTGTAAGFSPLTLGRVSYANQVNAEDPPDIVPGPLIDTGDVLAINPFFNAGCT